jgi:uroporphyrin-III C-methyltransferase
MVIAGSKSSDLTSGEWTAATALLAAGGSVVVMMGLARLPLITERLLAGGSIRNVPAALISKATWPEQRIVFGELLTICRTAPPLEPPAIFVAGKVVNVGRKLESLVWAEAT